MRYSLVIKARSTVEAMIAAREHGVILEMVDQHPHRDEVIASAEVKRIVTLQRWYDEDVGTRPPFPYGSLLHFTRIKKVRRRKITMDDI